MIKVANIISDTNIGGAGKLLLLFLENANREKFDIEVILPEKSLLLPEIRRLRIPAVEVPGIADKSFDREAVFYLRRLFREKRYDLIHSHATLSARVAAKGLTNVGVLSTRHSVFDQPEYKKRFPRKQMSGFFNNFFGDVILAVSPAAKENIVEIGADPQKIRVIMNGVPETRRLSGEEKAAVREKWGLAPDDFVAAIIARLTKVKGNEFILRAAEMLQKSDGNIKILIAGTGEEEEALQKTAREMGLSNVVFTGFLKEIHEIENIMDLQLNASYGTEATSLSLLEGMALGVPAIVSDFGGNPYVIQTGENGIVVPKKDPAILAEKILSLKRDRETYETLRQGARARYEKEFTALAMTRQIEEEYERLYFKKTAQKKG